MGKIATTIGSQIYGNVIGTLTLLATVVGVIVMLTPSTTASATGATPMQNSHAYLFVISGIVGLVLTLPSWIGMFRKGAKPTVEGISNTPALQPRYVPTVGLTFKGSEMDSYDPTPGRGYPRKLNVYFSNDGDDIHLGVAKWIKDQVGQSGKPLRIVYRLKNHLGQWDSESMDKVVPSGKWVKVWVGLDSSVPDDQLRKLTEEERLGIVEIPAQTSGGTPIKIRVHL